MDVRGKREMKRERKPLPVILAAVFALTLLAAGIIFLWPSSPGHEHPAEPEVPAAPPAMTEELALTGPETGLESGAAAGAVVAGEKPEPQNRFVISMLGDCTLSSSHYANHFESFVGDDLAYPFSNVAGILAADDLTLANLECSFSDKRLESESQYAFCGQPKYARSLALGGVDCVSMANNHTNDFGRTGVEDTAAVLEKEGITGIQENQGTYFDLKHEDGTSVRVGIYAHPFNGST